MTQENDQNSGLQYPETPRMRVTNIYHHLTVHDDYRWLEDAKDPKVSKWVEEQNNFTEAYLGKIQDRVSIHNRLKELYSRVSPNYYGGTFRGGQLFFMKWDPSKQQPYLVRFEFTDMLGSENIVFDPNEYDRNSSTSIDFFVPSRDGKLVAICLSKSGSEDGSLHIFNVKSGEKLPDVLPKVNYPTAGGSAEWNENSSGIYYTRYPREGEFSQDDMHFYQRVYFHKLGTDINSDVYVIGKEFPRISEIKLSSPEQGHGLLATVANGDGGEFSHYYMQSPGKWIKITDFKDQAKGSVFSKDGKSLFLLSRKGSPGGRILKISMESPDIEHPGTIFGAREGSIEDFAVTEDRIFVSEVVGGPSRLFVYAQSDSTYVSEVVPSTESISSIDEIVAVPGNSLLIRSQSFIQPSSWYLLDHTLSIKRTPLECKSPLDTSSFEAKREFATSKDGTRIPINLVMRRGTVKNRSNPTILYGYGGYGINLKPAFSIHTLAWLDMGGVFAVANLRGGGEYGDEWHMAGMLTRKQNVFDDFIACAEYLIKTGYTSQEKLAIEGGSNGGLLMGAVMTQRPELFGAVISHVGIYDMIQVESQDNGAFNITEFGTIRDPDDFDAIYSYSPYHRVVDGTQYPSVMLLSGENDGRVDPSHSKKMAARLQSATRSRKPILLRIDTAGHGFGTTLDLRVAQDTDVFTFLHQELHLS